MNIRLMSTRQEKDAATLLRQKYFFDRIPIKDPYLWTFDHKDHLHFVLYEEKDIVGYAHVQLWPDHRAAVRIVVIEEKARGRGLGRCLMAFCEKMLKDQGVQLLQAESRSDSIAFYETLGFVEMPFNDPAGVPTDPRDIAVGKRLK